MDISVKRTSVKGKLFRKISKNLSDYCIYLCSTTDFAHLPPSVKQNGMKTYITITGTNLPAIESVEIEYFGEWVTNKKYGIQFKADSYKFVNPTTEKGIVSFLKSKAFPGIGEKTAIAIVSAFGIKTLDTIRESPNKLLTVPGITPSKIGTIITAYKKNEAFSNITVFLAKYGLSSDSIVKINEKYGENAVEMIEKNPYEIQEIRGIGFKTCDKIARGLNVSLDSFERVRGGILETIKAHIMQTGDTCISVDELEERTLCLLNDGIEPSPVSQNLFRTVAKALKENGEIVFRNKSFVFLKSYDDAEMYSAKKLIELLNNDVTKASITPMRIMSVVEDYRKTSKISLTDNQAEAVVMALSNRVSVITGGPGTGKTTILSAVLTCYKELYKKEVTLLAPTGKAARRMTETTGQDANTIHSKIGIYDSDSNYEPQTLPDGLIVVDESSMVDSLLLWKLLQAVYSLNSHLLFIGDVDQLPSVSAGSVLYDMIRSKVIPVARLTEIFRQAEGGIIVKNSQAINSGSHNLEFDKDFVLTKVSDEDEALDAIKRIYKAEVDKYGVDSVALLCPLRRSQNGRFKVVADELNEELQETINPRVTDRWCNLYNTEYRVGDRVLQWKNTALSSNGDIGEIQSISQSDGDIAIKVHWDNGNDTVETRQSMADITLAYAISIHKSQGSEYKSVIIPLLKEQTCSLFKRNLIYTGTTRSKEKIIYVSSGIDTINACIDRCDSLKRTTLLAERIISMSY